MSDRWRSLAVAVALGVSVVAGSTARIVGDGGEYVFQALNFSALSGPAVGRRAIGQLGPTVRALSPHLTDWDIEAATIETTGGRRNFLHFWFYALLATPAMWLVLALGLSPLHAFSLTNGVLFGAAIWVLLPRIGASATILLAASPVVWWLDKAHTEVFTFSLLCLALGLARDRPAWALIAAGVAATQNVPIAAVYLLLVAAQVVSSRGQVFRQRGWLAGAIAGGVLVALHPAYNVMGHGTPSLLLYATRDGWPTWAELSAVVLDPAIGLLGNAPFLLIAVALACGIAATRGRATWADAAFLPATGATLMFLVAFAQTSNIQHGATPSISRYAVWLLPLSVPAFAIAHTAGGRLWSGVSVALALVSATTSLFAFHPSVPDQGRRPTTLAAWLWAAHPTWYNPLPEVFSETLLRDEGTAVPVATATCEKVLLAPGDPAEGVWPVPCYPAPLPAACAARDRLCFANRSGDGYAFVIAPGRDGPPIHHPGAAWSPTSEAHVRAFFERWGWWQLSREPATVSALRATHGVAAAVFGTDARFMVVLRPTTPEAVVRLRPGTSRLSGVLVDAETGVTIDRPSFSGSPGDLWNLPMPTDRRLLLLALTTGETPE